MDMLDMSVTLIVKAPNQQIEDQTIKCEPNWTIKKLKGHLSEVYPSKPRTEDQKLIYSGQLLPDSVTLREILRWYEGQEAHTVHLVCSPPRDLGKQKKFHPHVKMSEDRNVPSSVPPSGPAEMQPSASNTSADSSTDGLRHRLSTIHLSDTPNSSSQSLSNTSSGQFPTPDPRATWAAAMVQQQPFIPADGYDPNYMVQQLMWMQQAYAHYMTQYMQMMASAPPTQGIQGQGPCIAQPAAVQPQPGAEQVVPPVNNQQNPAADNANMLGEGEDDIQGNRDWLYWIYFFSRLMVLFSIVYFYSSPTRFIIVTALAILMYIYQIGLFRIQQPQPIVIQAVPENNNAAEEANVRVLNNNVNLNEPVMDDMGAAQMPDSGVDPEEHRQEQERPTLLAVTWTFVTSFFASLIPEEPGAI